MNAPATPAVIEFDGDASLGAILAALESYGEKPLVLNYGGRTIRPGYHVTEVKAGSFVTGTSYVGAAAPGGAKWWTGWTAYARN